MKPITISTHSFVDLITNSSSELFICDTTKSIETVKEIIKELAVLHNKQLELSEKDGRYGKVNIDGLWIDVFREPTVSSVTFDIQDFPKYDKFMEMFGRDRSSSWRSDDQDHEVKEEAARKMRAWTDKNLRPVYIEHGKPGYEEYEAALTLWLDAERAYSLEAYAKWNKMVLKMYKDLYTWAAKLNDIDITPLGEPSVHGGAYSFYFYESLLGDEALKGSAARKFFEDVEHAINWNYSVKKGDVLLWSASDNTIPYDFWQVIENTFSCERRHLG
jgi:hypothetical protein